MGSPYDQVGRLITVAENGNTVRGYVYDDNGNRTEFDDVEHGTTTTGTYDAQDRMITYGTFTYTYTADGAMRTKTDTSTTPHQTTTYGYDALGNLIRVDLPDGRAIEYLVDGNQRRVGKKVNGVLQKQWLYADSLRVVAELDGSGAVARRIFPEPGLPLSAIVSLPSGVRRIIRGPYNETILEVDHNSGQVLGTARRSEWGAPIPGSIFDAVELAFGGGIFDEDTKLIKLGVREYDYDVGRFVSAEPNAQDTNQYEFAQSDPINFTDPDGRDLIPQGGGQSSLPLGPNYVPTGPPSFPLPNPLPGPPDVPRKPTEPQTPRRPGDAPPPKYPKIPKPNGWPDIFPFPFPQPKKPDFAPPNPWPWRKPIPYEPPYCKK